MKRLKEWAIKKLGGLTHEQLRGVLRGRDEALTHAEGRIFTHQRAAEEWKKTADSWREIAAGKQDIPSVFVLPPPSYSVGANSRHSDYNDFVELSFRLPEYSVAFGIGMEVVKKSRVNFQEVLKFEIDRFCTSVTRDARSRLHRKVDEIFAEYKQG